MGARKEKAKCSAGTADTRESLVQSRQAGGTLGSLDDDWSRFDIEANPASSASTAAIPGGINKWPLSVEELRTYSKRIEQLPGILGATLRLHLRLGAPRIAQLLRLLRADIQPGFLMLWDGNGRPGSAPRVQILPLDARALEDIAVLCSAGEYALSLDGGRSHISYDQLRDCAIKAVGDSIADFQLKRLRSGVEVLLASLNVPQEVWGRRRSCGIARKLDRHCDGHYYMRQKANALELLTQVLDGGNPAPIR